MLEMPYDLVTSRDLSVTSRVLWTLALLLTSLSDSL